MAEASHWFYVPASLGSADLISAHWRTPSDREGEPSTPGRLVQTPLDLELQSASPPDLLIDLGAFELFEQLAAGTSKKSLRFLECCPFPTRLAVDLRPFVFAPVRENHDLDLWDAVGKQLAWRLSAHKAPVALIWETPTSSQWKPLAVLRDSLELWSGPELVHHNEPKPPEGKAIPVRRLCELLKI